MASSSSSNKNNSMPPPPLPSHPEIIEPETSSQSSSTPPTSTTEVASLHSLTPSVTDYVFKNGRRYARFREGRYRLPNDELEAERHDFFQHIYTELFGGKIVFSPLQDPKRILDLGTGTGIWAIDVADLYPSANIIGVDISPIQPNLVPENVQFEIDDIESDWTYSLNSFDLIHFQNLNGAIYDWSKLLSQIYNHLKPNGHVEAKEIELVAKSADNTIPSDSYLARWERHVVNASAHHGQTIKATERLGTWLREAGFVDIQERHYKLPQNSWPRDKRLKRLGQYQNAHYMDALQPFALGYLVDVLGWTREEMEVFLVGLRRDLADRRIHAYNIVRVFSARKPAEGENPQ